MIGRSFEPSSDSCACSDSSVRREPLAACALSFAWPCRNVAIWRAFAASATCWKPSPGEGSDSRPSSSTGVDGPACLRLRPRSSISARTLPTTGPAITLSPTLSVPSCTSTVATGPRPRSSLVSSTVPIALRFGLALRSSSSVTSRIISSSVSRFCLLLRRHFDEHGLAAPVFGHQSQIGELALDRFGIGAGLVDLVDRHDDLHVRGLGVIDRFLGLRHHAVIGGHDQHDHVGDLGAAGAHHRERGVAGRVEEHDAAAASPSAPDRRRCAA